MQKSNSWSPAFWNIAVGFGLLAGLVPGAWGDPPSPARTSSAESLVRQLGASTFAERESASAALIQMGMKASAALRQGEASQDREIRARSRKILAVIRRADFAWRLQLFAKGKETGASSLPGWSVYQKEVGDQAEARSLFVQMQRACPDLMAALDNPENPHQPANPRRAAEFAHQEAMRIQNDILNQDQSPSLGNAAALIFVAGWPQAPLSEETNGVLCAIWFQAEFQQWLTSGVYKEPVRKLVGRFILRSSGLAAYQGMALALEHDLAEGLYPAQRILKEGGALPQMMLYAVLSAAKFGAGQKQKHQKLLEPLLEDSTRCASIRTNSGDYETQLRDVALAAIMLLEMEDPRKFGFPRLQRDPKNVFVLSTLGFASPKERTAAFARWREHRGRP